MNRFGKLAPHFEPNVGQSDKEILYLSRGSNYTLFLSEDHATIRFHNGEAGHSDVKLKWEGAAAKPEISAEGLQASYSNYFRGSDPSKWRTEVPHYQSIRYREIWPGIDLVFHGDNKDLEWDFVVLPGGDPDRIGFIVEGAGDLELGEAGKLILDTPFGKTKLKKPLIYQDAPGQQSDERSIIDGRYELASNGRIGFHLGEYDSSRRLVIDPIISYSTYLGGRESQWAGDIAVDSEGNAVVVGSTYSTDFPTTVGAYRNSLVGYTEGFISKLNQDGSALMFSTFLGGNQSEYASGVALDSMGNIYVTGLTYSADFPTTEGVFNSTGPIGLFVTKLSPSGATLTYSTYIGVAVPVDLTIDSVGNVYVAGYTDNADFPTTADAFQSELHGVVDTVIFKLGIAGAVLDYSTYLGGRAEDRALGIAIDSTGHAYVAGYTEFGDFPTTPGSYQEERPVNRYSYYSDGFITKLNTSGTALDYSTYLGGHENDRITDIQVDNGGIVYVTGYTRSEDFPTTSGAYLTTKTYYNDDTFVSALNAAGNEVLYSTFCWESSITSRLALNSLGEVYLFGQIFGELLPPSPFAFQPFPRGDRDVYIAKLSSDLSIVLYNSYLGGGDTESVGDIQLDTSGNIYLTGRSISDDFPTTPGAFQRSRASLYSGDGFVTKIEPSLNPCIYSVSPTSFELDWTEQNVEIEVTVNNGCIWQVTGIHGSIHLLDPDKKDGLGSDKITLSVSQNHDSDRRILSFSVAGQEVEITQQGEPCSYTLIPDSFTFGIEGGNSTASIIAPRGCYWTTASNADWISINQEYPNNGDGILQFSVSANAGSPRGSSISIADQAFTVTQEGLGAPGVPPNPPSNISPENGDSNVAASPFLQWQPVDGATSYSVYIGQKSVGDLKLAQADLTSTSYHVKDLSAGITYFWKVIAKNQWGDSAASSPIWSFSVTNMRRFYHAGIKGFSSTRRH